MRVILATVVQTIVQAKAEFDSKHARRKTETAAAQEAAATPAAPTPESVEAPVETTVTA